MNVIIILTDSVALPRFGGAKSWDQTYISKLKEEFSDYEIINISIGGASIKDLRNQVNYYKVLAPEIVIIQCGIVDAAPRAYGKIELEIIKKLKIFRITKYFVPILRKYRAHHYNTPQQFNKLLMEIKAELNPQRFLALGIVPALQGYEELLPGITNNINIYNKVLESNSEFISLINFQEAMILPDYHHINAAGQEFIYQKISAVIKNSKQSDS